jgi:hypothetical protein
VKWAQFPALSLYIPLQSV